MAIKIGKLQLARLKKLVTSDEYDVLISILEQYIAHRLSEPIVGENAFQELRAVHKQQGGVEALKEFFDRIEKADFETYGTQ